MTPLFNAGPLYVTPYSLMILLGVLTGVGLSLRKQQVQPLLPAVILGALVFGHLVWVLFCPYDYEAPEGKLHMILRPWEGGYTLYGALLGGAVSGQGSVKFAGHTFDAKGADGKNLFAADHPSKVKGAAQGNLWSDAFSEDALGMLEVKMQNTRGENNEILDVAPDTIIIPNVHALKKAVFSAIGAEQDPATANNGFNYQFGRWNVIVWPYLNQ